MPEAEGKAELIDSVVASITRWQGYTGGVSRIVSRVAGSLRKHRSAIHEARTAAGVPAWLTLTPHTSSGVPCSYTHEAAWFASTLCSAWEVSQVSTAYMMAPPASLGPAGDLPAAHQVLRGADRSELNYCACPTSTGSCSIPPLACLVAQRLHDKLQGVMAVDLGGCEAQSGALVRCIWLIRKAYTHLPAQCLCASTWRRWSRSSAAPPWTSSPARASTTSLCSAGALHGAHAPVSCP